MPWHFVLRMVPEWLPESNGFCRMCLCEAYCIFVNIWTGSDGVSEGDIMMGYFNGLTALHEGHDIMVWKYIFSCIIQRSQEYDLNTLNPDHLDFSDHALYI
jgi:hypothetical protein